MNLRPCLLACCLLAACGQAGPLYLPGDEPERAPLPNLPTAAEASEEDEKEETQ